MNKIFLFPALLLSAAMSAPAAIESLTVGEQTYRNVSLKKEYPVSFFIQHDEGMGFIKRADLSEEQIAALVAAPEQETAPAPVEATDSADDAAPAAEADAAASEPDRTTAAEPETPESGAAAVAESREEPAAENTAPAEEAGELSGAGENSAPSEWSKLTGQDAPEIRLMDRELKEGKLSDLRGKVVLVNFNHPGGCEQTCLPDFALLSELQGRYDGQPVELVSVLLDFDETNWRKILDDLKITWKTALPGKGDRSGGPATEDSSNAPLAESNYFVAVLKDYDIESLASNVVIDRNGKVAGVFGPLVSQRDRVEAAIAAALAN